MVAREGLLGFSPNLQVVLSTKSLNKSISDCLSTCLNREGRNKLVSARILFDDPVVQPSHSQWRSTAEILPVLRSPIFDWGWLYKDNFDAIRRSAGFHKIDESRHARGFGQVLILLIEEVIRWLKKERAFSMESPGVSGRVGSNLA